MFFRRRPSQDRPLRSRARLQLPSGSSSAAAFGSGRLCALFSAAPPQSSGLWSSLSSDRLAPHNTHTLGFYCIAEPLSLSLRWPCRQDPAFHEARAWRRRNGTLLKLIEVVFAWSLRIHCSTPCPDRPAHLPILTPPPPSPFTLPSRRSLSDSGFRLNHPPSTADGLSEPANHLFPALKPSSLT